MGRQIQSYQWAKLLEHWGTTLTMLISGLGAFLTSQVLVFFMGLRGTRWIWFFAASFSLMLLGGGLIVYAKLPVYRSGRLFTFGVKSVPQHLAGYYRWGWRVFLFGVILGLCLLLSKP